MWSGVLLLLQRENWNKNKVFFWTKVHVLVQGNKVFLTSFRRFSRPPSIVGGTEKKISLQNQRTERGLPSSNPYSWRSDRNLWYCRRTRTRKMAERNNRQTKRRDKSSGVHNRRARKKATNHPPPFIAVLFRVSQPHSTVAPSLLTFLGIDDDSSPRDELLHKYEEDSRDGPNLHVAPNPLRSSQFSTTSLCRLTETATGDRRTYGDDSKEAPRRPRSMNRSRDLN